MKTACYQVLNPSNDNRTKTIKPGYFIYPYPARVFFGGEGVHGYGPGGGAQSARGL